jgi:Trk K+ transport system NAD-binding subunit
MAKRILTAVGPSTPTQPARAAVRGDRCIVVGDCDGGSRLAVAVAHRLLAAGKPVTVLAGRDDPGAKRVREAVVRYGRRRSAPARPIAGPVALPEAVPLGDPSDLRSLLESELRSREVGCVLGLASDPEQNLLTALVAHDLDSGLEVVLRAFDPDLADELESRDAAMSVARAYSVAHLSAPAFVAAAVSGGARNHVMTMRLATRYVSICRVTVPDRNETDRFPAPRRLRIGGLRDRTPQGIANDDSFRVLGLISDDEMRPVDERDETPLKPGDRVLVGGPQDAVLNLARSRCGSRRRGPESTGAGVSLTRWRQLVSRARARRLFGGYRDPVLGLLVLVVGIAAFVAAPPQHIGDVVYRWASMAVGSAKAPPTTAYDELLGAAGLLAGAFVVGLVTSMMAAHQIKRRVVERDRRRARRLRGHVIVVGTDDVGLRVAEILHELEIDAVLIEPKPERHGELVALTGDSAMQEIAERTPILIGALRDTLVQAGIGHATAVIATSEDNLVNVEVCMRAKRAKRARGDEVRTVARIFDDRVAATTAAELGIDEVVAAVDHAAPAFADAARGDGARSIEVDDIELRAAAMPARALSARIVRGYRDAGIAVLPLSDDEVLLVGPPEAVGRVTGHGAEAASQEQAMP